MERNPLCTVEALSKFFALPSTNRNPAVLPKTETVVLTP